MFSFVHIRDPRNTGDMAACPANYFDFGQHEVLDYSDRPAGSVVVYGGGAMVNWLHGRAGLPDVPKVIWGAGSSRHGETEPWTDPEGVDIMGVRDWSPEREAAGLYAPCSSCMSPLLDDPPPPTREAVLFLNANPSIRSRYPVGVSGLPTMMNDQPMAAIVEFLASAETIVTDSYHGCFWAILLGRRVVAVPYSSKFYGFRHPPAMSVRRGGDWERLARGATVYQGALRECRAATLVFHERVVNVIRDNA